MGIIYKEHHFYNGVTQVVGFDLIHMRPKLKLESGTLVTIRELTRFGALLGRKPAVHVEIAMNEPSSQTQVVEDFVAQQETALGILRQDCVRSTIDSLKR